MLQTKQSPVNYNMCVVLRTQCLVYVKKKRFHEKQEVKVKQKNK